MAKNIRRVVTTPPPKKNSNYENDKKFVTDTELQEALKGMNVDLSDYYTKTEVQGLMQQAGTEFSGMFGNYYTKQEIDTAMLLLNEHLGNFTTETQVRDIVDEIINEALNSEV